MRNVIVFLLIIFIFKSAFATHQAVLKISDASNDLDSELKNQLETGYYSTLLSSSISFINDTFVLPRNLLIKFTNESGDKDPYYDFEKNLIVFSYSFIHQIQDLLNEQKEKLDKKTQQKIILSSLIHTLFHELGHSLVYLYDLPVLSKEEDVVDSLASILLIEFFKSGASIAMNASKLFILEKKVRGKIEESDFWGEHSLDEQRYYNIICYVYGSNPEKNEELINEIGIDDERKESCIDDYEKTLYSWLDVLYPYLTPQMQKKLDQSEN